MKNIKNPIHIREYIIAISVGVILLILGNFFDYDLSVKLFNPNDPSTFGVIMSGICELPVCFCLAFGGSLLIIGRDKNSKVTSILSFAFGILAMAFSLFYTYKTFKDIDYFNKHTLVINILGVVFSLIFNGAVIAFTFYKFRKYNDLRKLFVIGFYLIIFVALVALIATLCKYLWSRPRPRYIFNEFDSRDLFHDVWILDPFKALTVSKGDNFKSFPSGHTTYAATAMFVLPLLPLLSNNEKEDKKINIILFYIGVAWTLLSALSRIYVGAHFLSDVAFGMIISSSCGLLINKIMFRNENKQEIGKA